LLGAGGMADVYRGIDRQLDRTVAIKLLNDRYASDPDNVERFRREAQAVARLNHPNIVTVLDRGEDNGYQYIVFELTEGESLKKLVQRGGRLPVEAALEAVIQIGRALGFAHENGVVHRDVKPQNVIIAEGGRAKVTDFGIAVAAEDDGITLTGT